MLGLATALTLAACGGGSNSGSSVGTSPPPPQSTPDSGCSGFCATADSFLTEADVQTIIAQAVAEAQAQNKPSVIAVVDRVGNVLGVYRMAGAPATIEIRDPRVVVGGLEGLNVPPELGAISKADTAVYFSSEGNAFTSRTAGQVAQEHFNPGDATAPAGPLFGVQISNLRCSDINQRFTGGTGPGTHSAPLALSPDPGGISLYKAGVPVGAVGVSGAKPIYTLDDNAEDRDVDMDEMIAVAGSFGFVAPADRRADQITAGGLVLQYTNESFSDLATNRAAVFIAYDGRTDRRAGVRRRGDPARHGVRTTRIRHPRRHRRMAGPRCVRRRRQEQPEPVSTARRHRWRECAYSG
jgi:uncharacterized protein GlcG (DUF336 family)